ncbi:UNVERIFIED_CONTAM: hypothetical protein Slati_2204200 [Sesamum latifolium]|uniref:Uncharacterized protein n=1 Tax=Sesamum latifolium TaxID=2727402 RepID=A0AAW2WTQ4_9LAMI
MAEVIICWIAPSRFDDNSVDGVSRETIILGGSAAGSANLGVAVVVDPEMGVKEVLETICKA